MIRGVLAAFCALLLLSGAAQAQVQPSGTFTPGHTFRVLNPSGTAVGDAGGAAGSNKSGQNYLTELGLTNTGLPLCINDALTNAAGGYHEFCFGANLTIGSDHGAFLTYNALGGASPLNMFINLNGQDYEFPFVVGGIVGPTTSVAGDLACWNNASGTLLKDCGNGVGAATLAQLQALSTATNSVGVWRYGGSSLGDMPPLLYTPSNSTCSLNAGAGDNGWQVQSSNGKCWIASFPATGVDLRWYGGQSGTDVTSVLQTIDSSMGNGGWPTNVYKSVLFPSGSFTLNDAQVTNIVELAGVGDYGNSTTIVPAAATGTTTSAIQYIGAGPFLIRDMLFSCSTYAAAGTFVEPSVCGNQLVLVEPPGGTQVTEFRTRNIRFLGGNIGMRVTQTNKADIEIDEVSTTFSHGLVYSDQTNTDGVFTGRARIRIKRCLLNGQYCVSTPVNVPQGGVKMLASHDLDVKIDSCIGVGFISLKACLDLTTEAGEQVRFDVTAMNVNIGVETKLTDINFSGTVPQAFRDRTGKLVMHQNMDAPSENCLQVPLNNTSAASNPDIALNQSFDVTCTWSSPVSWIANFQYHAGDVFTTSANRTYQVISDGISGSSEPVGSTTNTGIVDGTAIVSFRANTPSVSGTTTGVLINANSYIDVTLKAHNIAFGYQIIPVGSSDNTLRYANLKIIGQVQHQCVDDTYVNPGFGTNLTADHVSFVGSDCRSLTTNQEAIELGHASGGNAVNWTNLKIIGSTFTGGSTAQAAFRNLGGSISGDIVGSRLVGGVSAITIAGPTTLNIAGGILGNSAGTAATAGIIHSLTGSSGTITLNNVMVENSDSGNFSTWNNTAGSSSVVGNALNPPSDVQPTIKCTTGVDYALGTVPATAYLWGCSAANTWAKLY